MYSTTYSVLVLIFITQLLSKNDAVDSCSSIQQFSINRNLLWNLDDANYNDIHSDLSRLMEGTREIQQTLSLFASCKTEPCQNGGTCRDDNMKDITWCECRDGFAGTKCEIDVNQTCQCQTNQLIAHPNKCQLYYNCSQSVSPLPADYQQYPHVPHTPRPSYLHECPFPQLFSYETKSCTNYTSVKCGTRYETKNKCDYIKDGYKCLGACKECIYFHPDCEARLNGIFRNTYISPPGQMYYQCQDERIIYTGGNPCPFNMAPHNGKCTDLKQIPRSYWGVGYAKDCTGQENGNYRAEMTGLCDQYYTCVNGNTTLSLCKNGKVFDTKTSFCQDPLKVCPPCGTSNAGCS